MSRSFTYDPRHVPAIKPVRMDDQIQVWAGALVEVRDEPDIEVDIDIDCAYSETQKRIVARSVTVLQREGGPEVTSSILRTVRVQDYMRRRNWPVSYSPSGDLPDSAGVVDEMKLAEFDDLLRDAMADEDRWRSDGLLWIARTYRYAQIIGLDPAREVAERIGLAARTATRRIAQARAAGLLDG